MAYQKANAQIPRTALPEGCKTREQLLEEGIDLGSGPMGRRHHERLANDIGCARHEIRKYLESRAWATIRAHAKGLGRQLSYEEVAVLIALEITRAQAACARSNFQPLGKRAMEFACGKLRLSPREIYNSPLGERFRQAAIIRGQPLSLEEVEVIILEHKQAKVLLPSKKQHPVEENPFRVLEAISGALPSVTEGSQEECLTTGCNWKDLCDDGYVVVGEVPTLQVKRLCTECAELLIEEGVEALYDKKGAHEHREMLVMEAVLAINAQKRKEEEARIQEKKKRLALMKGMFK